MLHQHVSTPESRAAQRGMVIRRINHSLADVNGNRAVSCLIACLSEKVGPELAAVLEHVEAIYFADGPPHFEASERLMRAAADICDENGIN